jgi:hypothetical protein
MPAEDATQLLHASIATAFSNLDSARRDRPKLDVREEGWTEVWGGRRRGGRKDGPSDRELCGHRATPADFEAEEAAVRRDLQAALPPVPPGGVRLILTQHRVAWAEQLFLRAAGVPHTVLNSPYSATESSGPLPYLTDLGGTGNGGGGSHPAPPPAPALVGRRHPGAAAPPADGAGGGIALPTGSHIIDHLRSSRGVDLDSSLTDKQRSDGVAYGSLILGTLGPVVSALRYGDPKAWDGVYRPQSVRACLDPYSFDGPTRRPFFHLAAWFQAWSERAVALRELRLSNSPLRDELFGGGGDDRVVTVERAVAAARRCYRSLDGQLLWGGEGGDAAGEKGKTAFLLGTEGPTTVDVLLFGHLAEAICDVHLVPVLSEYKGLVGFFQDVHEAYFGAKVTAAAGEGGAAERDRWNAHANASNPFNQIPLGDGGRGGTRGGDEHGDAIRMMQTVALHCHDLGEALADAKAIRDREDGAAAVAGKAIEGRPSHREAGALFHRWRMHGGLLSPSGGAGEEGKASRRTGGGGPNGEDENEEEEDEMTRKNREQMEKHRRDAKQNDELWISWVLLGSIVAYVFAASSRSS